MKKNIALTWGWTWWHIFPLLAIYNFLKNDKELNFYWFWNEWWLEEEIAIKNDINFIDIPSWKIRRYFDFRNFYEPLKNITWIFFWIFYILRYRIDIIISKWWFVSLPLCIAWYLLWKKIYIHESDTVSGLSNKIISKIATKIFYTFPNELIDWKKHILTWQILNPELLNIVKKEEEIQENEKLEVLVIAWSQWSNEIFENLKSILNNLIDINFNIILWEKNLHFKNDFSKYSNVKTYDFVSQEQMWELMKKRDIAISRWWATTLWELYFFGVHTIIIPLSNSAQNHQQLNWEYFNKNFWSDLIWNDKKINIEIYRLLTKYKDLRKNSLNLDNFYYALNKIKKEIFN